VPQEGAAWDESPLDCLPAYRVSSPFPNPRRSSSNVLLCQTVGSRQGKQENDFKDVPEVWVSPDSIDKAEAAISTYAAHRKRYPCRVSLISYQHVSCSMVVTPVHPAFQGRWQREAMCEFRMTSSADHTLGYTPVYFQYPANAR
jgi:hypothetical protein